jgi:cell division inhibitor SepF
VGLKDKLSGFVDYFGLDDDENYEETASSIEHDQPKMVAQPVEPKKSQVAPKLATAKTTSKAVQLEEDEEEYDEEPRGFFSKIKGLIFESGGDDEYDEEEAAPVQAVAKPQTQIVPQRPVVAQPVMQKAPVQPVQQTRATAQQAGRPQVQNQPQQSRYTPNAENVVPMNQPRQRPQRSTQAKITICEPRAYAEVQSIASKIFRGEAVLINFHLIDEKQAGRIVDFLTGTVYAIDGDIQRAGDEIFLCTPKNMEIDSLRKDELIAKKLYEM